MYRSWPLALLILAVAFAVRADGPGDNLPDKVRPIPPKGVELAGGDRQGLESGGLLEATEQAGFDLALTCDQNVRYQQNSGSVSWLFSSCPRITGRLCGKSRPKSPPPSISCKRGRSCGSMLRCGS